LPKRFYFFAMILYYRGHKRHPSQCAGSRVEQGGDSIEGTIGMNATTRSRYVLRASLVLAKIGKDGAPVSINTIAEQENIPSVLLDQIFFKLKKAGIVASVRGPDGGVYFVRPLDKLTVKDLLDAAGEELDLTNYGKQQARECFRIGESLSHGVWAGLTDLINGYFGSITLTAILEKENLGGN
jgi:Rrf2 family iron-sulfur cluster assembly transcriptional regulator